VTDHDRLDGADLGETETVTTSTEIWLGELEKSEQTSGSDRIVTDRELIDATVVTDERGDQMLAVTVESDVMKRLPYRWDTASQPRTERERRRARRKKWASRGVRAISLLLPVALTAAIANEVMGSLAGTTFAGEPLEPASFTEVLFTTGLLALLVLTIVGWLHYGPRGKIGGGRR